MPMRMDPLGPAIDESFTSSSSNPPYSWKQILERVFLHYSPYSRHQTSLSRCRYQEKS
jgi:hypothetical protein